MIKKRESSEEKEEARVSENTKHSLTEIRGVEASRNALSTNEILTTQSGLVCLVRLHAI
jgi:hypothetical protein